jgi:hypothetical protein
MMSHSGGGRAQSSSGKVTLLSLVLLKVVKQFKDYSVTFYHNKPGALLNRLSDKEVLYRTHHTLLP